VRPDYVQIAVAVGAAGRPLGRGGRVHAAPEVRDGVLAADRARLERDRLQRLVRQVGRAGMADRAGEIVVRGGVERGLRERLDGSIVAGLEGVVVAGRGSPRPWARPRGPCRRPRTAAATNANPRRSRAVVEARAPARRRRALVRLLPSPCRPVTLASSASRRRPRASLALRGRTRAGPITVPCELPDAMGATYDRPGSAVSSEYARQGAS